MNAAIDQNSRQTITARLKTDAVTIERLIANPTIGSLIVTADTSGSVTPKRHAATDDNGRTSWIAVSQSNSDQIVSLQCDSSGALLVKLI